MVQAAYDQQVQILADLPAEMERLIVVIMNKPDKGMVDDWSREVCVRAVRTKDHVFISRDEWDPDVLALRDVIWLYERLRDNLRNDYNLAQWVVREMNEPKAWHEH